MRNIKMKNTLELKLKEAFKMNPLYESDGYKLGHPDMLAPNTTREAWNWIPRSLKYMHPSITKAMSAGQQLTWRYIHSTFQEFFFDKDIKEATKFIEDISKYLMIPYNVSYFHDLHKKRYLPVQIQALPEGIFTNPNIPHMAGINTDDNFAWLGLYLETLVSKLSWQMATAATIGAQFKKNSLKWIKKTDSDNLWFADFANHDFHSRGGNPFTSIAISLGHAVSNTGSDTLNAIPAARYYYDEPEDEVCINSVNASEHSVTTTGIFRYKAELEEGSRSTEIEEYYAFDVACEGSVENPDYLAIAEWLNLKDWLKKFPTGILSVVSDTFNLWKLITFILPRLKKEILARDGKLVIRPDSGDPVDITCGTEHADNIFDTVEDANDFFVYLEENQGSDFIIGDKMYKVSHSVTDFIREYGLDQYSEIRLNFKELINNTLIEEVEKTNSSASKGVIELLWDIFGGTTSKEGYKVLDSHIGAIYGDAINLDRQVQIYSRLEQKGFASTNIVLGVGSFTYVYLTRDSMGFAAKGCWFERKFDGKTFSFNIFKDPVTDDGTKKSLKGFQYVYYDKNGEIQVESEVSEEKAFSHSNLLTTIYKDGKFFNQTTLAEIRKRVSEILNK